MRARLRMAAAILLAAVFGFSAYQLISIRVQYSNAEKIYTEAEDLVQAPAFARVAAADSSEDVELEVPDPESNVDPYAEILAEMDIAALKEINPDVLGWILSPNTGISYPLLKCDNNDYYLNHAWNGEKNSSGAIFMECTNKSDFSDFNTIIYGHRMNNKSMFGLLHNYEAQDYWQSHPYFYINTGDEIIRYQVFAAYQTTVNGQNYYIDYEDDIGRQSFLDFCIGQSLIYTGVIPSTSDHILTLSTCMTRNQNTVRWVVQAVRTGTVVLGPGGEILSDMVLEGPAALASDSSASDGSSTDDSEVPPEGENYSGDSSAPAQNETSSADASVPPESSSSSADTDVPPEGSTSGDISSSSGETNPPPESGSGTDGTGEPSIVLS